MKPGITHVDHYPELVAAVILRRRVSYFSFSETLKICLHYNNSTAERCLRPKAFENKTVQ